MKEFPKRNTKFIMEDFFQTDVDDFETGVFMFISEKQVKIIVDDKLMEDCEWVAETGTIVSVYCFNYKRYMKLLCVEFRAKPYHNSYTIRRGFIRTHAIDDMAFQGTREDFIEWMRFS